MQHFLSVSILLFIASPALAQNSFQPLSPQEEHVEKSKLPARYQGRLISIARYQTTVASDTPLLTLPLPTSAGQQMVTFERETGVVRDLSHVYERGQQTIRQVVSWTGVVFDPTGIDSSPIGQAVITHDGQGIVQGWLIHAGQTFVIESLGREGLHVIAEIQAIGDFGCDNDGPQALWDTPPDPPKDDDFDDPDPEVVEIMFYYSGEFALELQLQGISLTTHAQNAIDLINTTYSNSMISSEWTGHVSLVAVDEGSFANYPEMTERKSTDLLDEVKDPDDGLHDYVHSARDDFNADVVVVFKDLKNSVKGRAYIYPEEDGAFAVVDPDAANSLTVAHEIGHLFGARHDWDPFTNPYKYGHGKNRSVPFGGSNNFATVMSYTWPLSCPFGCTRIPYYSNTVIEHNGHDMGGANWRNNRQVLINGFDRLAGFR